MIYANSTTIVQDTVDIIADSIVPHGPHPPHLPCTPIRGTNFDFCINQQDFMKVNAPCLLSLVFLFSSRDAAVGGAIHQLHGSRAGAFFRRLRGMKAAFSCHH